MRKNFGIVISIICCSLSLLGCTSQMQPPKPTATLRPTSTNEPNETPQVVGGFLPTVTLPAYTLAPTPTLTPLPKDAFDNFDELAGSCMIKALFGEVASGAIAEEQIISDLSVGRIWFSLYWSEGDLDLTLVQPDGILLDPFTIGTDEVIQSFTSEHGSEEYSIIAPQVGTWKAKIFGKTASTDGNPYMLEIWSMDATTISIQFDKKEYIPGELVKITANVHDTDMSVENNRDVLVHVITEDPTTKRYSFELYDDGTQGDEKGGDGVFTNLFENTSVVGVYKFYFQVLGRNQRVYYENHDPQNPTHAPFERECFVSREVKK